MADSAITGTVSGMGHGPAGTGAGELVAGVVRGDRRSAARLMRLVDDREDGWEQALESMFPHTGRAHVVGIAGSPGSGKSTIVDGLLGAWRAAGRTVGVVAVDPSSSLTGGALLGDRVRMQRHSEDPGVFIRSVATRGSLGGLSSSTQDIARILDAAGFEVVIIETVGIGQDEVEIASVADTVAVVLSPDTGDAIQIMKAGIMEVGDVFVVNKSDRPGADSVARELQLFFQLRPPTARPAVQQSGTPADPQANPRTDIQVDDPPAVIETVATRGDGIEALRLAIEAHRRRYSSQGRTRRLRAELRRRVAENIVRRLESDLADALDSSILGIESGTATPYSAVRALEGRFGGTP